MKPYTAGVRATLFVIAVVFATGARGAIDPKILHDLAFGESDEKLAAVSALTAAGSAEAQKLLQALRDGEVQTAGQDQVLLVKDDTATDSNTQTASISAPSSDLGYRVFF